MYDTETESEEECKGKGKAVGKKKQKRKKKKQVEELAGENTMEEDEKSMSFEEGGYGYNSEELNTSPSSGAEEDEKVVNPKFNVHEEFGHVHLEVGMEFVSLQLFKNDVKDYNIDLGRQFKWLKNDKVRARAKCSNDECDWTIYCSWNNKMKAFQIKTFNNIHTCCRLFRNKRASRDWVAKKLEKRLMTQPNMTKAEAYDHMKEEYKVHVHLKKVTKALQKDKAKIEGCEKEQYAKLRDYLGELLRSNPGSTCQMQLGRMPTKVSVIAYAIVDSETKENWKWFLTLLQEDIGPHAVFGWNFISDQQKGLIPALQEVMPGAYHRFCVQHVWKNFIKQWKDKAIRAMVWECSRCTTVPQFQQCMARLKVKNEAAWKYLDGIQPSSWVKAYFRHWPKCDNIINNMAEVWNAKIVGYRSKSIITLLEELRCYIMRRMAAHQRVLGTVRGKIASAQQLKLDQLKVLSNSWTPTWTGNLQQDMYEVSGKGDRVGVNLTTHTCACNVWQLTGLPCEHAIAAICHKNEPAENYVHQWLTVDALHATYEHTLNPVNSDKYWPASDEPKPLPPKLKRPIGRPKKHRKKDPTEDQGSMTKKVKRTYEAKCSKCGQIGHYGKSCKGPPASKTDKSQARPQSVRIGTDSVNEILLSQGGPSEIGSSQAQQVNLRGCSPPPSNPEEANAVLTEETMKAASTGTRSRFMHFMTTPDFMPPRVDECDNFMSILCFYHLAAIFFGYWFVQLPYLHSSAGLCCVTDETDHVQFSGCRDQLGPQQSLSGTNLDPYILDF
ncbi:uncharacterized protein LOC133298332 [Gastrolobium bilobum]|uniref:uncharacterized protein LOC133298332 n=1 Tax=Gastrolobium bilobum TaxID=150636 RepID=UPI002AB21382|nr:uncharacterized protein LOC133298332 [Gastrolobium bilobum]